MDTSATTRLFPALIHHIEGIIAAIATVGGGWVILRQFLYTDRIFFYIRMRVDLGEYNILWHRPTPARHCTTIEWGRSAVSIRGLREGGVYLRHYARFLLFWCIKNGVIVSPILELMAPYWMPGTIQQLTNRHGMSIDGVCNASWLWRVDRTNMGTFFVWELVPHIPSSEQPFWQ